MLVTNRNGTRDSPDASNGWEAIADEFIACRLTVGEVVVAKWATAFKPGDAILDIGCGFGGPYTESLLDLEARVYAIDASPTLVGEYRKRHLAAEVACEAAESSAFFGTHFHGILAVGLIFLLSRDDQLTLLDNMAAALLPGGRLLFTAPWQVCEWDDLLTGRRSRSLGRDVYAGRLEKHGVALVDEFTDEGDNHYFSFRRRPGTG